MPGLLAFQYGIRRIIDRCCDVDLSKISLNFLNFRILSKQGRHTFDEDCKPLQQKLNRFPLGFWPVQVNGVLFSKTWSLQHLIYIYIYTPDITYTGREHLFSWRTFRGTLCQIAALIYSRSFELFLKNQSNL